MKFLITATLTEAAVTKLNMKFPGIHAKKFNHHMTIEFGAGEAHPETGKSVKLKVFAYAADELGEAVRVVPSGCTSTNERAHITVSCDESVGPVYSNELLKDNFKSILSFDLDAVIESKELK